MVVDQLKTLLADHIEASLICYGYHWNVEGENFTQFHDLFADIQKDLYSQVDILAELIRALSNSVEYAIGSVDVTNLNKTIDSVPIVGSKGKEMCSALVDINTSLIESFNKLLISATKEKLENSLSAYATERIEKLNKNNWVLISHTK